MNKIMFRMAGMLCSLLIGFGLTSCNDDDYESVADSPLIGTWDVADGYDEAMGETIPGYEYLFQTMTTGETEYKDDNPDTFDGIDRPVQYDRVQFTAGLDGGFAIFYKRDASGNMVESVRYKAIYSENTIKLFYLDKTHQVDIYEYDENGNPVKIESTAPDIALFKEFAVETLDGNNLKIVWNKAQRIVVTYTNQYESYHFNRVG